MRIVIIGSVAGGTSAAAKARRNSEEHDIVIYDMDADISYSGCGIPYYIGEDYITRDDLTPRDASWFKTRFNIDIFTAHRVNEINFDSKTLSVVNLMTGENFIDRYDRLIIATGAEPVLPLIPGINEGNVFPVRSVENADKIKSFINDNKPGRAIIIGGGFIGLEMAENLSMLGIFVTIVEASSHVMPSMDSDMTVYIEKHLRENGVVLYTGETVKEISGHGRSIITSGGRMIETDMIIVAAGVRPNTGLVKNKGRDHRKRENGDKCSRCLCRRRLLRGKIDRDRRIYIQAAWFNRQQNGTYCR